MDTRLARLPVGSFGRKVLIAATLLMLLCSSMSTALANYNQWYGYGYWLQGQTNPISYDTLGTSTYYQAASFSTTPHGGLWRGVYNMAGDVWQWSREVPQTDAWLELDVGPARSLGLGNDPLG